MGLWRIKTTNKMEHTLRSEVPRTFSWVSTSRSVLYLHVTFYIGGESEAVSAEHALWVKLAGNGTCGIMYILYIPHFV